jgi:hypothetical protein
MFVVSSSIRSRGQCLGSLLLRYSCYDQYHHHQLQTTSTLHMKAKEHGLYNDKNKKENTTGATLTTKAVSVEDINMEDNYQQLPTITTPVQIPSLTAPLLSTHPLSSTSINSISQRYLSFASSNRGTTGIDTTQSVLSSPTAPLPSKFDIVYLHPLSRSVLNYFQSYHHDWIVSKGLDRCLTIYFDGTFLLSAPATAVTDSSLSSSQVLQNGGGTASPYNLSIWNYYDMYDKNHWLAVQFNDDLRYRFILQDNYCWDACTSSLSTGTSTSTAASTASSRPISQQIQQSVLELMTIVNHIDRST